MYTGLYYLLGGETVAFVFFLVWWAKYTSKFVKILTTVMFIGAAALLATNNEGDSNSIEPGRFWGSVALVVVSLIINASVGASNQNTIK